MGVGVGLDGAGLDGAGLDGAGSLGVGVGEGLGVGEFGAAEGLATGAGCVRDGAGRAGAVEDDCGRGAASRVTDVDGEVAARVVGAAEAESAAGEALARLGTGRGIAARAALGGDPAESVPCCARATPPAVPVAPMTARVRASA